MEMTIGELARRAGVAPSAIRYYEDMGLMPSARRVSGCRIFDETSLNRLIVIAFAKEAGFTLRQIKQLVAGSASETRAGVRWTKLATAKLAELEALSQRIDTMRKVLREALRCGCVEVETCTRLLGGRHPQ